MMKKSNSLQIVVSNVNKRYKDKVILKDVNLKIEPGIFGLMGKNGAGKTTLMKILATLLTKDEGEISICGEDISNDKKIRSMIGYLPQDFSLYSHMKVYDVMNYLCILTGIEKAERKPEIREKLLKVNLQSKEKVKVKELSGGMKRRLGIAQALLGNPPIIIIDEPTVGLDPEERIRLRSLLSEISNDRIIIISTHIIEDIEAICDYIGILDEGSILFSGEIEELLSSVEGKIYSREIPISEIDIFKEKYTITKSVTKGKKVSIKYLDMKNKDRKKSCEATIEDAYIYWTHKKEEDFNDSSVD
jgi:ABC-2 type transport system ATP-binding protein